MILDKIHAFTVGLMGFNDQKVIQARYNVPNLNYKDDLILIDTLVTTQIGSTDNFDGVSENMEYSTQYKGVFTFDFYGSNAYDNVHKFANMLKSLDCFNLARENEISIYHASRITDLKNLQGSHNYERYQIEVSIMYFVKTDVATLRIDTAQTEFINSN